jgi:hypothetical protein
MASFLGGGFMGEGGMHPSTVDFVSTRKTCAVSDLLSRGRVGLVDEGIRLTTLSLFRGRVGLADEGIGETTLELVRGGVGSIDDRIRSTTLTLFGGGVGLTEEGTGSVTWVSLVR